MADQDAPPPPRPLPPGLAAEPEIAAMPAPAMRPYAFGALLMRVGDDGVVQVDMACGFAYGFSKGEAEADFGTNVRRAYPGHSVTKIMGQEVLPLAQEPAAVEPPPPPPAEPEA